MGRQGQHGVKWCKIEVHFYLACQKICLKFELAHWLKMAKGYPSLLLNVSNLTCLVQAAPLKEFPVFHGQPLACWSLDHFITFPFTGFDFRFTQQILVQEPRSMDMNYDL